MALPKITRSLALRALLVIGVLFAIGGVTLAGAASSGLSSEAGRAPRSVALVKAHQYTARPRPKHDATGERGLPGEPGPPGQAGPAGRPDRLDRRARPDMSGSEARSARRASTGRTV